MAIVEIGHQQLIKILKRHYHTKIPLCIWGIPGIGKSDSVRAAADELAKELKDNEFGLVDLRLSQVAPEDLKGLPFPNRETKETEWLVPSFLPKTGNGILFLDEIGQSPPSIQSAAYQLILDRKLGDYNLPVGWMVVAASNRVSDRSGVIEMHKALQNRFSHYVLLTPPILDKKASGEQDFIDWAIENNMNESIIFFLKFKPSLLEKFDPQDTDPSYATPRSWFKASQLIEGIKDVSDIKTYVASCVGMGTATEFIGWYKLNKKLDMEAILKDPKKAKDIKELDMQYTLASGLVSKYKQDKKLLDKILAVCDQINIEMCILTVRMAMAMTGKDPFSKQLIKCPNYKSIANKLKFLL